MSDFWAECAFDPKANCPISGLYWAFLARHERKLRFLKDATLKRAFVRSLEIIGEASKKLPEDVKATQPDIEWRKVTGMRDRLIHDYFGVDYTIVWDVATTKLPDLRVKLQALLEATEKCQQANVPDAKNRGL